VKIHDAEHSEASARGVSGELVLQPISRTEVMLSPPVIAAIVGSVTAVLFAAYAIGHWVPEAARDYLAGIGLIVISPVLVVAGYTFLRDDELEPYRGVSLAIRAGICAAVYAASWVVLYLVPGSWKDELWSWVFLAPPFLVAGGFAAFASLDLSVGSAFTHYCLYVGAMALLAYTIGLPVIP